MGSHIQSVQKPFGFACLFIFPENWTLEKLWLAKGDPVWCSAWDTGLDTLPGPHIAIFAQFKLISTLPFTRTLSSSVNDKTYVNSSKLPKQWKPDLPLCKKQHLLSSPPWSNARHRPGNEHSLEGSPSLVPAQEQFLGAFPSPHQEGSVTSVVRWQSPLSHLLPCNTLRPFFSPFSSSKTNQPGWDPGGGGRWRSLVGGHNMVWGVSGQEAQAFTSTLFLHPSCSSSLLGSAALS